MLWARALFVGTWKPENCFPSKICWYQVLSVHVSENIVYGFKWNYMELCIVAYISIFER
jgi:hypothetical protein